MKNATLTWRNKPAAFLQFISTFIFILLIYGVAQAIEQQNRNDARYQDVVLPPISAVSNIPDCSVSVRSRVCVTHAERAGALCSPAPLLPQFFMKSPCYTLLWAPNTSPVAANIVANIMANNVPAIPAAKTMGFASVDAANAWMMQKDNDQRVMGVYELFVDPSTQVVDFGLQVNGTWKRIRGVSQDDFKLVVMPMQVAAEREIARYFAAVQQSPTLNFGDAVTPTVAVAAIPTWSISLSEFAHPAEATFSLVGAIAPTFLLAAAMFVFTIQIFNIVQERELKLRSSMRVMGVSDGVWWLSWLLWDLLFTNIVSALLICAFGNAFPFDLFRNNQFSVVFIHFWLFEASLTALGYFLSTLVDKAAGSTFIGFTIFLFGFIFQLVVSTASVPFTTAYGGTEYGGASDNGLYRGLQVAFSVFPPTVFAKGITDLGLATSSDNLSGIKWRTRDSYCYCNPAWLERPLPTAAGLAPPSPLDFTFIHNEELVQRNSYNCSASDYRDYALMFPAGTCDYSIQECWQWMVLDFGIFMSLALLFDQLLKNEYGVRSFSLKTLYSWLTTLWFLAMVGLVTALALVTSAPSENRSAGGIAILVIILFCAFVYTWSKIFDRTGYNGWVIASLVGYLALGLGSLVVAVIFFCSYACGGAAFRARNRKSMPFMIPLAWVVYCFYWLFNDICGCVSGCLSRKVHSNEERSKLEYVEQAAMLAGGELPGGLDEDVAAEENAIKARLRASGNGVRGPLEPNVSVEVRGLVKSFDKFHAVCGNFFRVEPGKLFALLGPNGAGKTTTINLLTGVLPITAGDASVCGLSILGGEMPAIRRLMGVCPQFDILWGELTAREHLRLFAALKGLPRSEWESSTTELLERTKLTQAADRRSSTFSGGMKRRLSVAIALIGDPEVVYLDEPTTGMDPITRRYVWDIILEAKAGRAIVLTTHSMEEADVLADTITIIAKGRLRCYGSALRLKNKFGAGYRIAASVVPSAAASARDLARMGRSASSEELASRGASMLDFFRANLGIAPAEVGRAYSTFVVPRAMEPKLAGFLKALQDNSAALGITDVQMSQTTLEQVFLLIAREAEKSAAAAEGRTLALKLALQGGRVVTMCVPWGAEHAVFPETGEIVEVSFIQDDEGRLVYAHHTWRGQRVTDATEEKEGPVSQRGCCF